MIKTRSASAAILGILGLALATALVWALLPRPVAVETALVTRSHFQKTVDEDGKTRVRQRYVISAPLAGTLQRIALKAGDAVNLGDLMAVIIPSAPLLLDVRTERELSERLGAAEATKSRPDSAIERAKIALAQAKADLDRMRQLAAKTYATQAQLEQGQLEWDLRSKDLAAAKFAADAAGHEVEQVRAALAWMRQDTSVGSAGRRWEIRSPVSGEVLHVNQESEAVVSVGTPLLEIADPHDLEVVVDVLTTDAERIEPRAAVRLDRGAGPPLAGEVRLVEPAAFTKVSALGVEEQRTNVIIDITAPAEQWSSLGDAYRLDAHIVIVDAEGAITVPTGALFRDAGGWATFVVQDGFAHKRAVEIRADNGTNALVEGGLNPGERIILYAPDKISDGTRVAPD